MPINFIDLFPNIPEGLATGALGQILHFLIGISPIALAVILFFILWPLWVRYVRAENQFKEKYSLVEIKLPKETFKSPLSMELFLTALHQTGGEGTWYDKYWLGKTRAWFSLEIVSIEGQIHFFVWMRSGLKSFVESSLYAQFPGIEVHEMPSDYSHSIHFNEKEMAGWACELELTKPDPYPIKTYIDYGLDKDPKEEFKVDPIAPLLEYLGSIGANQQVWIQIVVRAHKKDHRKPGTFFQYTDKWKDEAAAEINKLMFRDAKTKEIGKKDDEGNSTKPKLTKGEEDIIKAIEHSLTKFAYDVGIRCLYVAKKEMFNPANIGGLTGSFKQFSTEHLNGFKPHNWSTQISFPWQDFRGKKKNAAVKGALEAYKRRAFFFPPLNDGAKIMVLNSEELATIFHFPGQVAPAPTLTRIPSKKAEAPANLPI